MAIVVIVELAFSSW